MNFLRPNKMLTPFSLLFGETIQQGIEIYQKANEK